MIRRCTSRLSARRIGVEIGVSALLALALQAGPASGQSQHSEAPPAARFEATFASVGRRTDACKAIPLFFRSELGAVLPAALRPQVADVERSFDLRRAEVDRVRQQVDVARDAMRLAVLRVLRLVEETTTTLTPDLQSGTVFSTLWRAADLRFRLDRAEQETLNALVDYYWQLSALTSAEQKLREATSGYYTLAAAAFPALPASQRTEALTFFATAMRCLEDRRERVFCVRARDRRQFWKNAGDRAWSLLTNNTDEATVGAPEPVCGTAESASSDGTDPIGELADAFLSTVLMDEEYAWLAPQTTTTLDIYSSLLEREQDARRNQDLNARIDAALRQGSDRDEAARLAYQPMGDQTRMEVFRMRLDRAELVLDRKLLALEAAYDRQTSVMLGLGEAASKALQQGAVTAKGLATAESVKVMEPQLKVLALVAITQQLLGDSMSLMVATPIQDALTTIAFKPAWKLFGEDVKTSVEKAWDVHEEQARDVKRQRALLDDLREHVKRPADAEPYLLAFSRGQPSASPIGQRAPTTLRSLVEDADFIAATNGGLPWLFEPFCNLASQCTALFLRGASYELEANTRLAAVRIAAMRGLTLENPDLRVTRASLEKMFKPGEPPTALVGSSDLLTNWLPGVGALWQLYNLPSTVVQTIERLKGNIKDQDDYLAARVGLQQSLKTVLNAMEAVDFDYRRLEREWPEVYAADHLALLNGASEYADAYRMIRHQDSELEKRLLLVRHRDPRRHRLTAAGRTALAAAQSRQDLESADLAVRGAFARLAFHALSGNYQAAALQAKSLEQLERQKRALLGVEPAAIDLSEVVHAFEAEATRGELVQVYAGLYQSAIKETVLSLATDALADSIVSSIADKVGIRFVASSGDVDVVLKLYQQFNPWAGLFSEEGIFNSFQNGLEGAAKSSTAQILARRQNLFSEGEIESAVDLVYGIARDIAKGVRDHPTLGDPEEVLDRTADTAREQALGQRLGELDRLHAQEIEPLLRQLDGISDDPDHEFQREQLVQQIAEREASPRMVALRQELAALTTGADDSRERRIEAETDTEDAAVRIASEVTEVEARNRVNAAPDGSVEKRSAARAAAAAEELSRLRSDQVSVEDLQRLVADDDPLNLRRHLLGPDLDIVTVRAALKRARANDPEHAGDVDDVARRIDQRRIELVQQLIDEFMASSHLSDEVVAIVQGGAAEGNPEYQGIFGDIDFTIFVVPGANDNEIKKQILAYFKQRSFSLATQEESSPMDTETFVQPAGRLDAATTPFATLIVDAAVKRKDATRFYSEGGGKWAMNNYAFSGKPLWGDIATIRKWTRADPREGYGLALDMARHLGFLTDPRNAPESLDRMTPSQRVAQLGSVLKDSKYFLRLVDAYLMGHDGLGNALYNNRMRWRQDQGPDASYHAQIAKDLEALVLPGGGAQKARLDAVAAGLDNEALDTAKRSIFTPEDLRFVDLLARMKQKGDNPDPWALIDGDTPEAKAVNAAALARWMEDKAPRILAATAAVWQNAHERAMTSDDADAVRAVRTDAHRIATTVAAADIFDVVGAKAMLRPPARVEEREDPSGNRRFVDVRLSPAEHLAALRRGIDADRQRRKRLLAEIEARQEAVRQRYPPEAEMTDADRAAVEAQMKTIFDGVQGSAMVTDEDDPAPWLMFWLRR